MFINSILKFLTTHSFLLINILFFYFFHIYTIFTYFLFYVFIKNNTNIQSNVTFSNDVFLLTDSENIPRGLKKNNSKKNFFKKNSPENSNSEHFYHENNSRDAVSSSISTMSKKNIDSRFFIFITYFITIYYGYVFICDLIIKISLVGLFYFICKNHNDKFINSFIDFINANEKYKPFVIYLTFLYNLIHSKINTLQNHISNPKDISSNDSIVSLLYSIFLCFDYINNEIITNNIAKFINFINIQSQS